MTDEEGLFSFEVTVDNSYFYLVDDRSFTVKAHGTSGGIEYASELLYPTAIDSNLKRDDDLLYDPGWEIFAYPVEE